MTKNFVYFKEQPKHYTIGKTEKEGFLEEVTEAWECKWCYRENVRILKCPAGYQWDGASVPRAGWTIIGITPGGLADGPSLAHDIPYRAEGGKDVNKMCGCTISTLDGTRVIIDREEADWLFREFCIFAGMCKARARAAYRIVTVFGRRHWGGPMPSIKR